MLPLFAQAVEKFDLYNEARRKKLATRKAYNSHLRTFGDYLERKKIEPTAIDEDVVLAFLAAEGQRGLSDHTVVDRFIALRTFFKWCQRRKPWGPFTSPLLPEHKPEADKKEPRRITLADYQALLHSINGPRWIDARDRFLIAILYRCGLRISEAVGLQMNSIDMKKRRFKIHARTSKSRKDRYAPFNDEVFMLAMEYLCSRPTWEDDPNILWVSDDGAGNARGPMTIHAVRPMLKRRFKKAGLPFVNPHGFRHGYAMDMLNEGGAEMSSVSALLGHASVKTTEAAYAEWLIDPLQREYEAAQQRLNNKKNDNQK